jgi:Uma2 family endonuclease
MTSPTLASPSGGGNSSFRRFSVAEYHKMIQAGILTEEDNVELLEGVVVLEMPRNPPHDGTIDLLKEALRHCLPAGWLDRIQEAITLPDSEPEPDVAIVRGTARSYLTRHPEPLDVGLVVEVSDSSLAQDRTTRARVYARAGLPCYWIVNLVDLQLEVLTGPSGPAAAPGYSHLQILKPGDTVALVLGGVVVATLAVSDLLP